MKIAADLNAEDAWNFGAEAYIQFVESGADYYRHLVHGPALLAACGDPRGLRALDIGCGQGYFSRLLARSGALTTGIDLSERLIARAIELEANEPLGIVYRHMNAARIDSDFAEESFDLATGCMSIQDMLDPNAALRGAHRSLKRGGRLVFSIPHPCTDTLFREWKRDEQGRKLALELDQYFDTGPTVCHWNMGRLKYPWSTPCRRYTLTEWSGMIRDAEFTIQSLSEARPDAKLLAEHPELEDCARMPYFLIFELAKTP